MTVRLGPKAQRDVRKVSERDRQRIIEGLDALDADDPNIDVKALAGHSPWRRLRVGNWRVLYRTVGDDVLVARIVNRRDLNQAVRSLDD